jgi:biofilm protein TabA
MIQCSIHDFHRYQPLNAHFAKLSEYLRQTDLRSIEEGRHDISGDAIFVIASRNAVTRADAMLEVHRRYIDVHTVVEGAESLGWAPLSELTTEDAPFDEQKDYGLYRDAAVSEISVTAGSLVIFFPEDAHAPLLGDGHMVHKCVFKVLVD